MANYRDPSPTNFPDDYEQSKVDSRVLKRTKAVREKMYGIDTREAMAQAEEITSIVANEATETAASTQVRQNELEQRYNNQIEGNTDINEVIDARKPIGKPPYQILGLRLNQYDADLFGRAINVLDYGVKGDGVTDDYAALQNLLDTVNDYASIIFPHSMIFNISHPLFATKHGLKFYFNNSRITYVGDESLGVENGETRKYGALHIEGELTNSTTSITAITYNEGFSNGTTITTKSSVITVADATDFDVGDYIAVTLKNPAANNWSKTYEDNPAILNRVLTKIIAKNSNNLVIDLQPDAVFTDFTGQIEKVNPIKDVEIYDYDFTDGNNSPIPITVTSTDRESWVGGLKATRTVGLKIKNTRSTRHRFPGLSIYMSAYFDVDTFYASKPRLKVAGCGYGIQCISSSHGRFKNLDGDDLRHLIDFSGSGHMVVDGANMTNDYYSTFDCHGQGEFDITYQNCKGNFIFGNGIDEFQQMTGKVTLVNCQGRLKPSWVQELKLINSDMVLFDEATVYRIHKLVSINGKLSGKAVKTRLHSNSRGGAYGKGHFILIGTDVVINKTNSPLDDLFRIVGYYTFKILASPNLINQNDTFGEIGFYRVKTIDVGTSNVENIGFRLSNALEDGNRYISDSDMNLGSLTMHSGVMLRKSTTSERQNFVHLYNLLNCSFYSLHYSDMQFDANQPTRWLRIGEDVPVAVQLALRGATFKNSIEYLCASAIDPVVTLTDYHLVNVSESAVLPDANGWSSIPTVGATGEVRYRTIRLENGKKLVEVAINLTHITSESTSICNLPSSIRPKLTERVMTYENINSWSSMVGLMIGATGDLTASKTVTGGRVVGTFRYII